MNFIFLCIGIFTNYFLGKLFCRNLFFERNEAVFEKILINFLCGLFFTSFIYFGLLLTTKPSPIKILFVELILIFIFLFFSQSLKKEKLIEKIKFDLSKIKKNIFENKLIYIFITFYSSIFILRNIKSPHGEIDAINHWGRAARFLYRDSDFWTNNFNLRFIFHGDYPLFIQSSISRIWNLLNFETQFAAIFIHYLFFLSFPIIFFRLLKKIYGKYIALISTLFLICFPFYSQIAMSHYADIQISFFMFLSTFFIFNLLINETKNIRVDLFFYFGFLTGITTWIKNEGILFSLVILFSLSLVFILFKEKSLLKKIFYSFSGWFCSAIPFFILKFLFREETDIFMFQSIFDRLNNIFDYQRFITVLQYISIETIIFNNFSLVLLILSLYFFKTHFKMRKHVIFIFSLLFLFFLSYIIFYLFLTPLDVIYHIKTSFNRILAQYHPIIIMAIYSLCVKNRIKKVN